MTKHSESAIFTYYNFNIIAFCPYTTAFTKSAIFFYDNSIIISSYTDVKIIQSASS